MGWGGGAESWSSFSPPIPALHGNPLDGLPKDELNIVTLEDGRKKERKSPKALLVTGSGFPSVLVVCMLGGLPYQHSCHGSL